MIKCSFCGLEYAQDDSIKACKGCPMSSGCCLMKCPRCGYESPAAPAWLESIIQGRKNDSR